MLTGTIGTNQDCKCKAGLDHRATLSLREASEPWCRRHTTALLVHFSSRPQSPAKPCYPPQSFTGTPFQQSHLNLVLFYFYPNHLLSPGSPHLELFLVLMSNWSPSPGNSASATHRTALPPLRLCRCSLSSVPPLIFFLPGYPLYFIPKSLWIWAESETTQVWDIKQSYLTGCYLVAHPLIVVECSRTFLVLFNHGQISRDLNVPEHIHPSICLGLKSHVGRNSASRRSVPGLRLLEGSWQRGEQGSTRREEDTHREARAGTSLEVRARGLDDVWGCAWVSPSGRVCVGEERSERRRQELVPWGPSCPAMGSPSDRVGGDK